jgi:Tfp pilus assembly protein PilO
VNRRGPLVVGIVFGVIILIAIFFLVLPKMSDVTEAEDRLAAEEAEELPLQTELARLRDASDDAATLRRELARFQRAVPPVADLPGLINDLQTAADVSGVDFFQIDPGTPTPSTSGQASEIPASIRIIGGFFPIDEFLFRLETLPRAAKVISVTVAEGPEAAPQVDVQLEVQFFTTDLEAGPGAPVPEAPGGTEPETEESPAPLETPPPGETTSSPTPGA